MYGIKVYNIKINIKNKKIYIYIKTNKKNKKNGNVRWCHNISIFQDNVHKGQLCNLLV